VDQSGVDGHEKARINGEVAIWTDTLQQVVEMMGGETLRAAPVLTTSPTAQSVAEVQDVIAMGVTDVAVLADIAPTLTDLDIKDEDDVN